MGSSVGHWVWHNNLALVIYNYFCYLTKIQTEVEKLATKKTSFLLDCLTVKPVGNQMS